MFAAALLLASLARAQELPELLHEVAEAKAQRLIEYNSPWLQAQLYSAKRFRIVTVDADILMKDDDFEVTLFDDLESLHLTKRKIRRGDDSFAWGALIPVDLPNVLTRLGATQTVLLSGIAWDTDEDGRALISYDNRFEFSPNWTFDVFDRPILSFSEEQDAAIAAGPPPQTPEQIARHKALLQLNKHAFYSVTARFVMLFPAARYILEPLKYTPKYHLVVEVDPAKIVPVLTDRSPGEVASPRDPADLAKLSAYENFIRDLPAERDVPVVEEPQ